MWPSNSWKSRRTRGPSHAPGNSSTEQFPQITLTEPMFLATPYPHQPCADSHGQSREPEPIPSIHRDPFSVSFFISLENLGFPFLWPKAARGVSF